MDFIPVVLILVAAVGIILWTATRIAAHIFNCSHCGKAFQIKWSRVLITEHSGNQYKLECPHCRTKDWCLQQPK